MSMKTYKQLIIVMLLVIPLSYLHAQQIAAGKKLLMREYNLVPQHSKDTQYYQMESRLEKHALDGTPLGTDVYRLALRCVPSRDTSRGDEYTCLKFTVQVHDSAEVSIPSLTNWKYLFSLKGDTANKEGEVFGIAHSKFDKLTDANGRLLPIENAYHVYNAFVDFHTMGVFSERTPAGNGVQNLKHIGDKIIHSASFSQPHEGADSSYFKNGQITLAFKGLSLVNEKTCAMLEYDSGESSFYLVIKPIPNMRVTTKGSSHYWGDIYKDLTGGWIQKANLHELVISETTVPGMTNKINSVIERSITITNGKL